MFILIATTVTVFATASLPASTPSPRVTARPPQVPGKHAITIHMMRDSTGMHFIPAMIDARVGDTLRFVNGVGKHNVDFLADSNSRRSSLPVTTSILEQAGDITNIPVTLKPGRYFFQCDPHAAMGMVGHLVVRARPAK